MAAPSRYHVSAEAAGVNKGILKNKLGIKNQKQLENAETALLADTYSHFLELLKKGQIKFDLSLLFSIHQYFLCTLYEWAGKVRTVNISKNDMLFAPTKYIDKALEAFDDLLKTELAKPADTTDVLSQKLAIIHNEFNVIHPFREGNGRTIRLFLDLISNDSGYKSIDWSKKSNMEYLHACIKGTSGEHEEMAKIIKGGLKKAR